MAKDQKDFKERNNSCGEVKLLVAAIFFLGFLATVLQFVPHYTSYFSNSQSPTPLPPSKDVKKVAEKEAQEVVGSGAVVRRAFRPVGNAAYLFIQMGAYRGGLRTFAVIGLASKPLHVFAKPQFHCSWAPHGNAAAAADANLTVVGTKILPDWGYGRVYTVVVVICTFPENTNPGADGSGGRLVVTATTAGGSDAAVDAAETFVALEESPGAVNMSVFTAPPKYDYLYCGSPLYGNLSPQRLREWLAYHARLFGDRGHFVLHDAGGVHRAVMDVLRPWIQKGVVTLQDIREQERFDGYYHNQFLVVNDCLHRYRFDAKWMFFFDVDEFVYVEQGTTLAALLGEFERYTQFTIEQMPMSGKICRSEDAGKVPRMWGFEKLVYRDVKRGIRRDRKYAIQPRNAFSAGVHMSQNIAGRSLHKTDGRIKYFHYHGTIANHREPCKEFSNATELWPYRTPYVLDETLRQIAGSVKRFELKMIGRVLVHTQQ